MKLFSIKFQEIEKDNLQGKREHEKKKKERKKEKVKRAGYIGTLQGPCGLFLDDGNGSKNINIK